MSRKDLVLPLALLLAAACEHPPQPAAGPTTARDVEHTFLALDLNRDGVLTRGEAEASPVLGRRFASADADGDGLLTRYEYNAPAWRAFRSEPD